MKGRIIQRVYVGLVYAFFYVPLLIMFIYAFNDNKYAPTWKGFTLRWFSTLFDNTALLDAAINSLTVAVCAASGATILGSLAALCLKRYSFAGRKPLFVSVFLLTLSPDIVMGISLLIVFIACKIELGFVTLLVAHIVLCAPFVTITVLARIAEFDEHLIEAARDLGASEAKAFWHILLPITAPAVVAGWLLSFTLSLDDVLISAFVTGPTYEVLPVKIFSMVKLGVKPDVNALAAIMFVFTLIIVLSSQIIIHHRRK
ncbi:MAG: spermidine/putrescine ABC transporter permease PotC [Desulfarculales bacterium]|nr:spermidine/putrescine ABC transporter permease PotC [Desulfarculales bacterium]